MVGVGRRSTMIRELIQRSGVIAPAEYLADVGYGMLHPRLLTSGATPEEEGRTLPGDDVIHAPGWEATRAITIAAPVENVWPWLVQMGYSRGGWYAWPTPVSKAYVTFMRFPRHPDATRILPRYQKLEVGDHLLEGPGCMPGHGSWVVTAVEPRYSVVLHSCRNPFTGLEVDREAGPRPFIDMSWAFVVEPVGRGTTRLLARTRVAIEPAWAALPMRFLGLGDTVMQRTMLEGIEARAVRMKVARRRPARTRAMRSHPSVPRTKTAPASLRHAV
jgi:hypothetical protein